MGKSMIHWNGDMACAFDTETSGTDPDWHEIVQIAALPLDSNFDPRNDVMPFYVNMKPNHPERVDPKALRVSGLSLSDLMTRGLDQERARDLFLEWVDGLGLPYTPGGYRKRLIPVGHNYFFDRNFISRWLGQETYDELISHFARDTMTVAAFLNDNSAFKVNPPHFQKLDLRYVCSKLGVEKYDRHDALEDCAMAARAYKALVSKGEWCV
jgi:DNA polymerase III epsilon subunit-like protein